MEWHSTLLALQKLPAARFRALSHASHDSRSSLLSKTSLWVD